MKSDMQEQPLIQHRWEPAVHLAYEEPVIRAELVRFFVHRGYLVHTHACRESLFALLPCRIYRTLFIIDWDIPWLNPAELCRHLKKTAGEAPLHIIMISDDAPVSVIDEAFEAGIDDFLFRPVKRSALNGRMIAAERLLRGACELEQKKAYWEEIATNLDQQIKQQAELLIKKDRISTLGIMSAGMAHEINNPASFISGNAQLIERFLPTIFRGLASIDKDDQVSFIQQKLPEAILGIKAGVSRISSVVENLKSYSRHETASWHRLGARELVNEALQFAGRECEHLTISIDVPVNLPEIYGDKIKLEQVLVNLIINASHATSAASTPELHISAWADERELHISVRDNGHGIDPEIGDKIWTPFFTTKEPGKGTGLGLHVCREIIKQHHGQITLGHPASGAEMLISLPVVNPQQELQ